MSQRATQAEQRELAEAPAEWRAWWLIRGRLVTLPDGSLDLADAETFHVIRAPKGGQRHVRRVK